MDYQRLSSAHNLHLCIYATLVLVPHGTAGQVQYTASLVLLGYRRGVLQNHLEKADRNPLKGQ